MYKSWLMMMIMTLMMAIMTMTSTVVVPEAVAAVMVVECLLFSSHYSSVNWSRQHEAG